MWSLGQLCNKLEREGSTAGMGGGRRGGEGRTVNVQAQGWD